MQALACPEQHFYVLRSKSQTLYAEILPAIAQNFDSMARIQCLAWQVGHPHLSQIPQNSLGLNPRHQKVQGNVL